MKWNHNGIKYRRGCFECLIAQFDGQGAWWHLGAIATQQTVKSEFKRLGEYLGAQSCEVKHLFDENDHETETPVSFLFKYDGTLLVSDEKKRLYVPYIREGIAP